MKNDVRVTLLLPPELREKLRIAAEKCRTSMTRLCEKAIAAFLDDQRYEA